MKECLSRTEASTSVCYHFIEFSVNLFFLLILLQLCSTHLQTTVPWYVYFDRVYDLTRTKLKKTWTKYVKSIVSGKRMCVKKNMLLEGLKQWNLKNRKVRVS